MKFWKMNGNGNDFIVTDGTSPEALGLDWPAVARALCPRRSSIGADGLLVIQPSRSALFTMRLFNADGSEGEMCGNGARCIARFAFEQGMAPASMVFDTLAGPVGARVNGTWVDVDMGDARVHHDWTGRTVTLDGESFRALFTTVGVPHLVLLGREMPGRDFARKWGRQLRRDEAQFSQGTNVTFAVPWGRGEMEAVTYERGVEDLTDSCGTGCVAVALAARLLLSMGNTVEVHNPGGTNRVTLREEEDCFSAILGGSTSVVAWGQTGSDIKIF